jgi:transposase-like protein
MEKVQANAGRSRAVRTEDQILSLLEEHETSGYTVREFCEISELNEATFYSWLRKYRSREGEELKGFAQIEVLPSVVTATPGLFAEVRGIRIYKEVSAEYLKTLLA